LKLSDVPISLTFHNITRSELIKQSNIAIICASVSVLLVEAKIEQPEAMKTIFDVIYQNQIDTKTVAFPIFAKIHTAHTTVQIQIEIIL